MKKLFYLLLVVGMFGCATVEFHGENKGLFNIDLVTKSGKTVQITIKADVHIVDGEVILATTAYASYQNENGRYTCTVKIGSDGKTVKEILNIKEDCELDY